MAKNPLKKLLQDWLLDDYQFNRLGFLDEQKTMTEPAIDTKVKKLEHRLKNEIYVQIERLEEKLEHKFEPRSHITKIEIDSGPAIENQKVKADVAQSQNWNKFAPLFSTYLINGYELRYAPPPGNDLFHGRRFTENAQDDSCFYEVYISHQNPATIIYRLIQSKEKIMKALTFSSRFIAPACQIIGEGDIKMAKRLEFTYGIANKEGNNWRIKERAVLKYFSN